MTIFHINTLHEFCITSHDKVLYTSQTSHITSDHMTSHQITWPHIGSHDLTSDHMTPHDLTSDHMTSHDLTSDHLTSHDLTWPHIGSHDIIPSLNFPTSCTCSFWGWIRSGAVFWVPNMSTDVSFLPRAYETVELHQWLLPGERYPLWSGRDWWRKGNRAGWPRERFAALYIKIYWLHFHSCF